MSNDEVVEKQRRKQQELMSRLRNQLQELETYAYETGDGGLPSNVLLERQGFILEQLKACMPLNLEEIEVLTSDKLKEKVDTAIKEVSSSSVYTLLLNRKINFFKSKIRCSKSKKTCTYLKVFG